MEHACVETCMLETCMLETCWGINVTVLSAACLVLVCMLLTRCGLHVLVDQPYELQCQSAWHVCYLGHNKYPGE
jgi:hypothetical protein